MYGETVESSDHVKIATVPVNVPIPADTFLEIVKHVIGKLATDEFLMIRKCSVNLDPEKGEVTISIQR